MPYLLLPFGWPLLTGSTVGDDFGAALSSGDLDGDGFTDLAVGAPGEGGTGVVHVYLGTGLEEAASFTGMAGSEYGAALAIADLDGDGASELIVGAPGAGAAEVIAGLVSTATWLDGDGAGDRFGAALSAGDLDGDGVDDLVVGAPATDADTGAVWIFTARLTASDVRAGDTPGGRFGASVAADGDIDGDGDTELLVGAPGVENASGDPVGRASLYSGGAAGPATSASWTFGGTWQPHATSVGFGDFDGDGFDDVLVVAGETGEDEVAVFHAAAGTLPAVADWSTGYGYGDDEEDVRAAAVGDLDGDGDAEIAYTVTTPTVYGCACNPYRRTSVAWGSATGPVGWPPVLVTAPRAFAPVGDLDGNGLVDVAFASDDGAGAVTVRLLTLDDDGDGWPADWGGALADCDDALGGTAPDAVEVDGDGVDADCDGQDDAPTSTHASTCPDLTDLPEARALASVDAIEALPVLGLLDEVVDAVGALPCERRVEVADEDCGACESEENGWTTCAAGDGAEGVVRAGARTWTSFNESGPECNSTTYDTTSTVADVALDEPTASGVARARFTRTDAEAYGTVDYADGTRTTLRMSWWAAQRSDGEGTYEWTEGAALTWDACALDYAWTSNSRYGYERWTLADAAHSLAVHTLGPEVCRGLAEDLGFAWANLDGAGRVVDSATWTPVEEPDEDGDGWPEPWDCDDADADAHPCGQEDGLDDVDEDCDGDLALDSDGDGVLDAQDCAPDDPAVHPGAVEACNGVDDDCDTVVDRDAVDPPAWFTDADADGAGNTAASCGRGCDAAEGCVDNDEDCDDADPDVFPGAVETCDRVDEDCDGVVDEAACRDDGHPGFPERRGCIGCSTGGAGPAGLGALVGLGLLRRRRYRATPRRIAS